MLLHTSTLLTFLTAVTALGINCRGSGACNLNSASLGDLHTQVQQFQAKGQGGHNFATGVQIACAQGQYASICAYFQNGASGTADRAAELIQGLMDHGCSQCGSNPTNPGNNVNDGELTVNIVSNPCCHGTCQCPI